MSSYRYPDSNRNGRDRSPPYRDRRPSNFGGGYPPRTDDTVRPNPESGGFPPRDVPRGPKSLADAPRGPATGGPLGAPPTPRDGRGRGFPSRGEPTPLRDAPPLSSGPAPPMTNTHNSWRADRDRDRDRDREFDRDRRERRPTPPPRRSPIRDLRDARDQRDFPPRDLDVSRARRNSRDGPPSAGSTFPDPPLLGTGSSYRGSGIGRGRGGRDFGGRGRPFHPDDRDRHHDPRDRPPDRSYRPRSRSPIRRDRDLRDEREFDRRDRDDRRFPREYDSYIGPAGAAKPGPRALDTHRGPGPPDSRHVPGTPTGPTPHPSHHASPADRLGPQVDAYSRRSSIAMDPSAAKDSRRDPGKDDLLLASRAEASRERYAPRPSSPPAAVPAFGSNVWRNPTLDVKPSSSAALPPKTVQSSNPAPAAPAPPTPASPSTLPPPPTPSAPAPSATAAPAITAPPALVVPKNSLPSGPVVAPTGPKADRILDRVPSERPNVEIQTQETRPGPNGPPRMDPPSSLPPSVPSSTANAPETDRAEIKGLVPRPLHAPPYPARQGPPPSASSAPAKSPPQGPAPRPRPPPTAPQAALRANVSPSFSRTPLPPYLPRDTSSSAIPPPPQGPRSGSGDASINASPKSLPANIPTGPKADRTPMAPRPPPPYAPSERPVFNAPRAPMGGGPKSMQWVRPGLIPNRPSVPTKRELPMEDRERTFGTAPKAPKLEFPSSTVHPQHAQQAQFGSSSYFRTSSGMDRPRGRAASAERSMASSLKPVSIETRRHSDVVMAEASPRPMQPPMSAASSAPEAMQDSDDDLDLDEDDFAESEAKYNRDKARLEAKLVDLSAPHLRATTPLQEIILLSCVTADHLPAPYEELEQDAVKREDVPRPTAVPVASPVQSPAVRNPVELLTPNADESDNYATEKRAERSIAPATAALRLRREASKEPEVLLDLTGLPYLGSGPPTPLSDIEQDRPGLPDAIKSNMLKLYQRAIRPELNEEDTLRQYAAKYKQWRLSIRQWDDEREQDEQERQPSAEPSLKATTPDVQSSTVGTLLDVPGPTGRRSHASRWATELDLEAVIKESLKTAEEERMGKQDSEPKRSMADPEKEADLPLELSEAEAQRRNFVDTNFQREPGQGIFAFHYEPPEDDFTLDEHRVMVANYRDQYAKKWGRLAEILYRECGTERTYKDCINHYYATKWAREYKGKVRGRRGGARKRGGGTARGRGAIVNMERSEAAGEDGLPLPVTETGRPRRSAAPTFGGMEADFDPTAAIPTQGRVRRQTDADGNPEKASRRSKANKEKVKKVKNPTLVAAPSVSPVKPDRKEKVPGVKAEDEFGKRPVVEMPAPIHVSQHEDRMGEPALSSFVGGHVELPSLPGSMPIGMMERQKAQPNARPGPSSYWSVSELQDFEKNVAHFGTDWIGFANHMGTKTHIMIKNQYLRMVEGGKSELEQAAKDADARRERGDDLGPPPTPTPAPKRRYESTQSVLPRNLAPAEQNQSPLLSHVNLSRNSPPQTAHSTLFLPQAAAGQVKPPVPSSSAFSPLPETPLASHKPHHNGPRAGYFSEDLHPRIENRMSSQASFHHPARAMQSHVASQIRNQEQHQQSGFRGLSHQERENLARSELQQEQEHRFQKQQHARRISQEMHHQRAFPPGGPPPLMPPVRSNSIAKSPEHRPMPYSHSRQVSQAQAMTQPPSDVMSQAHGIFSAAQQLPSRSSISTPPVKEEPRYAPPSAIPQAQHTPVLQSQHQARPSFSQPAMQSGPPPTVSKPAAPPRKSNLLSLLNDPEPEEPTRKKPTEQGPPSHSTTPSQQTSIAPPPTSSQASGSRRDMFGDSATTQPPYGRSSYVPQSSMPSSTANRSIDLTSEQTPGSRPGGREGWQQQQQRQQFHPAHSQAQQSAGLPTSHPGLPQPAFNDSRLFGNHRSVFAQHNSQRHNPSPPPMATYANSPHLHSRTPSGTGSAQHAQAASAASSQILQPNPYAQVDPPGAGAPPSGPMGMRPSPHLRTSHIAQQREMTTRNEHAQAQNPGLTYSNPPTPSEHPAHQSMRGPGSMTEQFRGRDPRDLHHDLESLNSDRDTSRELSQRTEYLREQLANPHLRSTPIHEDLRYQPQQQDRGYLSQRSHTPLSRNDGQQPPPLQHPPHSSLGANNHPLYGQRLSEEPSRFSQSFPRDRGIADRIRQESAQQQQAALNREEQMRRESQMREQEMRERERELRDREAHFRDSLMRGNVGPYGRGPGSEQRQPPTGPNGHMDWANSVRPPQRDGWQR
ncbi:chromatin binding [Ascochyta rabiei]|uniref:Chromatin binding n=1 Tax=Didymella rabiei TaxID=5454 RepID=A0A163L023_DIDRA|nr:chromatin binding [Ascochyta rabiei]